MSVYRSPFESVVFYRGIVRGRDEMFDAIEVSVSGRPHERSDWSYLRIGTGGDGFFDGIEIPAHRGFDEVYIGECVFERIRKHSCARPIRPRWLTFLVRGCSRPSVLFERLRIHGDCFCYARYPCTCCCRIVFFYDLCHSCRIS